MYYGNIRKNSRATKNENVIEKWECLIFFYLFICNFYSLYFSRLFTIIIDEQTIAKSLKTSTDFIIPKHLLLLLITTCTLSLGLALKSIPSAQPGQITALIQALQLKRSIIVKGVRLGVRRAEADGYDLRRIRRGRFQHVSQLQGLPVKEGRVRYPAKPLRQCPAQVQEKKNPIAKPQVSQSPAHGVFGGKHRKDEQSAPRWAVCQT